MPARKDHNIGVIWCPNRSGKTTRVNGWSYPPAVERLLKAETHDERVLQLFGGLSRWGVRLDIDPTTRPDVVGDAWLPPFAKDSFDTVILDPPYIHLNAQMKQQLLTAAAWISRKRLFWFHTLWVAGNRSIVADRSWLVRVGDNCHVRCLQEFMVMPHKQEPPRYFKRGPQMKYNRWLVQPQGLPFGAQGIQFGEEA